MAAIAVLAVAFAAFAVIIPANVEGTVPSTEIGETGFSVVHESSLDVVPGTSDATKITVSGSATAKTIAGDSTGFVAAFSQYQQTNPAALNLHSAITIIGFDHGSAYTIKQTNPSVLNLCDAEPAIKNGVKEKQYNAGELDGGYSFLIPKDDSSVVTIEITKGTDKTVLTFDFSKVSTKIVLGNEVISTPADSKWTYSGNGNLAFNGYTGKEIFYSNSQNLNVTFAGKNTITVYGVADESGGQGDAAIKAHQKTLTISSTAADAELNLNLSTGVFGLWGKTLTIGNSDDATKTTKIVSEGGNRGLYNDGAGLTIQNSYVDVEGSEVAIRSHSIGDLTITNSTVIASIDEEGQVNDPSTTASPIFGVKVKGDVSITGDSVLTTDGLMLDGTSSTITLGTDAVEASGEGVTPATPATPATFGRIVVTGDYTQNPNCKAIPIISGLYVKNSITFASDSVGNKVIKGTPEGSGIFLTATAEAYNITVEDAKGAVVGQTVNTPADANKALKGDKIADVTYTGTTGDFLVPEGKTLTLVAGSAYNGTIKTGSDAANQSVKFTNFVGTVKIAKGSLQITDGAISVGSIEVKGDTTVVIDNVTITGSDVKFLGEGTVVVKAGKAMTVSGNLTIGPNVTVEVYGKLLKSGTGAIVNNGKLVQMSGGVIDDKFTTSTHATLTGNNVSYTESDMKEIKVSGDTEKDLSFSEKQLVTVLDAGLNIYDIVTVAGKLVVPEGAKLTIMAGGKLILTNSAELVVEGTIEIEEKDTSVTGSVDGKLNIIKGTVTVSGSIANNGKISVGTAGESDEYAAYSTGVLTIAQDGVVTVGENGKITTYTTTGTPAEIRGKVVVEKSATLDVKGLIAGSNIYNAGTVTIDSSAPAESGATIYQTADGAVVDVVSYTKRADMSADLLITDAGMVLTTYRDSGETVEVTVPSVNSVKITPTMESASNEWKVSVSGLKVVSSVGTAKSKTTTNSLANAAVGIYNEKQYSKYMDVAGSPVVSYKAVDTATGEKKVSATIEINNSTAANAKEKSVVTIIGEVALGENVTLDNKTGKLSVTGMLSAGKDAKIDNTGKIVVSKNGEVSRVAKTVDNVEAALYETSEKVSGSTVKTYHYVTLDAAIVKMNEAGVKNVVLKADQTVSADGKIPAEATLDLGGYKVTVSKDKTLTVASGATVKNGAEIIVNGTLFAEKKTDLKSITKITADVKSEEIGEDGNVKKDGWVKYTSLANALAEAKSGETITLTGDCTLTADTVIPEGVTVVAGENKITLKNGVKLTIDGVLKTDAQIIAESAFALTPMNLKATAPAVSQYSSTVVVNGKLMSAVKYNYADVQPATISGSNAILTAATPVAGAYYEQGAYYVISSLAVAQKEIADITSKITVNGAVSAGDAAFVGTDDCTEIVIGTNAAAKNETVLTVKSLTLSGMKLVFAGATGYFTGSVAIGDASVSAVHANGFSFYEKDSKVYLGGIVKIADKGDSMTIAAGTVYTADALNVTSNTSSSNDWFNYVTVAAGATLAVDGSATVDYITVDGILDVPSAKTFTVDVQMNVNGTVTVAASTGTAAAGTLNVKDLYVGISDDDLTGAAATFNGPVALSDGGKILVSSGAAVDDAFADVLKDMNKTAFNVNGSVWFTAYAKTTGTVPTVTVENVPVKNVKLVGWEDKDGKLITTGTDNNVTSVWTFTVGQYENLYAKIDTAIYKVVIKADEGIADVYLNGQAMAYGLVSNGNDYYYAYSATVAAGDYKVTYTLKNGWSGTATLYKAGTAQSGNAFSVSGNAGESDFTLSGVEKSGYVEPVTPSEDGDDDGLTITDYLLIVLVVLIVIMAVIVAMRLMRS